MCIRAPRVLVSIGLSLAVAASTELTHAAEPPPPEAPSPPVLRAPPPPLPEPAADEGGDTVLGSHVEHGGYGGPALKVTTLGGRGAMLAGGEGGWIIGRTLVLGGGGYGTVTDTTSPSALQSADGNAHLDMGYGGFRLGGIIGARRLTHIVLGVLIGGGGATSTAPVGAFRKSDTFFVVEPDLAAEVNLARHVRLGLGGSYRFVGGTDVTGFTATRLSGPAAELSLRFGVF